MARTPRTPKNVRAHEAQLVAIESLKPYKGNPRRGDVEAIRDSLRVNGQYRPVVVRASTREVLAGNHTLQAAQAEGWSELWATFVDCDARTARRIVLVDNRTNDLASYDDQALADLLGELPSIEGTGWSERELVSFVAQVNGSPGEDTEPSEVPSEPRSKTGDLWVLGEHRLLCGDATVAASYELLMGGELAQMVFTDPPYGVEYEGKTAARLRIANDRARGLEEMARKALGLAREHSAPGASAYVFHPDSAGLLFRHAFAAAGFDLKQVLIWVKQQFVLGRQDYQWQHEPILYGWKEGKAHRWYGGRKRATLLDDEARIESLSVDELVTLVKEYRERELTTVVREDRPHASAAHPTMKPVRLCARLIANSSARRDAVLDPFAGSGSTLIACENLKRRCYAMEIDPGYCDVIVDRWERHTGQKAKRGG